MLLLDLSYVEDMLKIKKKLIEPFTKLFIHYAFQEFYNLDSYNFIG